MQSKDIPFCPLMSAGSDIDKVCALDRCAWYHPGVEKCSVYVTAYESLASLNAKYKSKKEKE